MLTSDDAKKWTQQELDLLHQMVKDYEHAVWFRGQLKWWGIWLVGLPAVMLSVWEPIVKLVKLIRGP
jgi:hypothetical protein